MKKSQPFDPLKIYYCPWCSTPIDNFTSCRKCQKTLIYTEKGFRLKDALLLNDKINIAYYPALVTLIVFAVPLVKIQNISKPIDYLDLLFISMMAYPFIDLIIGLSAFFRTDDIFIPLIAVFQIFSDDFRQYPMINRIKVYVMLVYTILGFIGFTLCKLTGRL